MMTARHPKMTSGYRYPLQRSGIKGIGDLTDIINQDFLAYTNWPPGGVPVPPDQFASILQQEIAGYCATFDTQCPPDVLNQAQAIVGNYSAWYSGVPVSSPIPGIEVAPVTDWTTPVNALYNVAPAPTYVPPQPVHTALVPPATMQTGVTPSSVANGQGGGGTPQLTGDQTQNQTGEQQPGAADQAIQWVKDNWVLLALAGGGIFLLTSMKK